MKGKCRCRTAHDTGRGSSGRMHRSALGVPAPVSDPVVRRMRVVITTLILLTKDALTIK